MAAGGYTTRRELLNGAFGVSNGYRYRAEICQNVFMGPRSSTGTKRTEIKFRRKSGLERGHLLGINIFKKQS